MNEKIGVMTLFFNMNYGATLQAYSLQQVLKDKGWQSEDIKYYREIYGHAINERGIHAKMRSIANRVKHLRKQVSRLPYAKQIFELKGKTQIRQKAFDDFIENNLDISAREYSGHDEIKEVARNYKAFICGSDNIWNKNLLDTAFFLEFVPDDIPKIAYAPGMSTDTVTDQQKATIVPLVKRFDALSVREATGRKLIADLSGRDVFQALDPTLLRDKSQWRRIERSVDTGLNRYVFCYFVGDNEESRECVEKYANEHGLKIVTLPKVSTYVKCDQNFGDVRLYDIAPDQFIWLIDHADYIFTDSFHGTTFSVLLEKEFFCFRRFFEPETKSLNLRIDSLLEMLDIHGRIFESKEQFDEQIADAKKLDYSVIIPKLENEREKSMKYLDDALAIIK